MALTGDLPNWVLATSQTSPISYSREWRSASERLIPEHERPSFKESLKPVAAVMPIAGPVMK